MQDDEDRMNNCTDAYILLITCSNFQSPVIHNSKFAIHLRLNMSIWKIMPRCTIYHLYTHIHIPVKVTSNDWKKIENFLHQDRYRIGCSLLFLQLQEVTQDRPPYTASVLVQEVSRFFQWKYYCYSTFLWLHSSFIYLLVSVSVFMQGSMHIFMNVSACNLSLGNKICFVLFHCNIWVCRISF